MRKIIIALISFFACMAVANATAAYPKPITVTQPDGTTLTIRIHGDEFLHWTTCGNSLVAKGTDGYWHYAKFATNGASNASGARVMATPAGDGSKITPPAAAVAKAMSKRQSVSSSLTGAKKSSVVSGSGKHLVILIQFADKSFSSKHPKSSFSNMLNKEGYSDNSATGSVLDYYSDNSHEVFTPQFDVVGPITVSGNISTYAAEDDGCTQDGAPKLLAEACQLADSTVDFSQYDLDGDGYIDNIFFYFAGYNAAEGADGTIWPHAWAVSGNYTFDGKQLYSYACSSELTGTSGTTMAGIGTFCHEFGHVIGLPDFYDTDYEENGEGNALGCLSLMSSGNYNNSGRTPPYLTYEERNMLGWAEDLTLFSEGSNTLSKISENKAYYLPTPTEGEYYLFESRPCEGWDAYTYAAGMAIYHIDKSDYMMPNGYTAAQLWSYGQCINDYASHQCMDLVESVASESDIEYYQDFVFPGYNNVTSFTATTTPALLSWAGHATGYSITGISFDSTAGTTTLNVTKERMISGTVTTAAGAPVAGAKVVITSVTADKTASGGMSHIRMSKAAGAKEYNLTTDADGKFEQALTEAGTYSVSVTKEGYLSYKDNVEVDAIKELSITLLTPADGAGQDLQKYTEVSNYIDGSGESGGDYYVGLKYEASELTDYVGSSINSISFMVYNGGDGTVDKMGVQVYFGTTLQCDRECSSHIFGSMCTVDISDCNLTIPSGQSVTFVYYLNNSSYENPLVLADYQSPVEGGNLYSFTDALSLIECEYSNFVISANITVVGKIADLSGINYIPRVSSYKAGDSFELKLAESSINPPSSVTWTVNGESSEAGSIELSAGVYTICAHLTYSSGRIEVIETKINVSSE